MTRTIKMLDTGEVVEVGALAGDALIQLGRAVAYVAPVVPVQVAVAEVAPIITRKRSKSKPALKTLGDQTETIKSPEGAPIITRHKSRS